MSIKNTIRIILSVLFVSFIVFPVLARSFERFEVSTQRQPQAPHLVYPVNEKVNLTGDFLEFKWWHADIGIRGYDFRLYKGYDMYQDNLILKKSLSFDVNSINVEASLFENNQVYTWSVIQIGNNGEKSDKSFVSFRISKPKK